MGWDVASQQQSVRFILLKSLHFIFEALLELLIHYCEFNQFIKFTRGSIFVCVKKGVKGSFESKLSMQNEMKKKRPSRIISHQPSTISYHNTFNFIETPGLSRWRVGRGHKGSSIGCGSFVSPIKTTQVNAISD